MKIVNLILINSLSEALIQGEKLLYSIPQEIFSSKPLSGGTVLNINHPAFQVGHLNTYPHRILSNLGIKKVPGPDFEREKELFWKGAECFHDPERKIYPGKDELIEKFLRLYSEVKTSIEQINDQNIFSNPPKEEPWAARFGSVGVTISYLVGPHLFGHLGQISAWRRAFKMPPV